MRTITIFPPRRFLITAAVAVSLAAPLPLIESAYADPPPWAPAHGYRNKHKDKRKYQASAGAPMYIEGGRCNREAVGKVIGGVVGGVLGAQIGKGDGKTLATIAGAVAGWFVGGQIGKSMDDADRYCTGQVLEHAEDGHPIKWKNPNTNTDYTVTPTRTYQNNGQYCREYTSEADVGGKKEQIYGTACRQADGSWNIES